MNYKRIERIIGAIVYLLSVIVLFKTVQPSVSFWDCGEVSAAAFGMQIPHPPGSPFMTILGRFFAMLPTADNMGLRINYLSVITSGFTVLMLYFIIVKLIENYKGRTYTDTQSALFTYLPAAIGALAFSFSHSFWFNGTESEIYALNTTIFAAIVYVVMVWNEKADNKDSTKYLFLISYLIGISVTLRTFGILAIITVVMIIMYRKYDTDEEAFKLTGLIFLGHVALLFVIGLVMWYNEQSTTAPSIDEFKDYDSQFKIILLVVSAIIIGVFWKKVINKNSIYVAFFIGVIAKSIIHPGIVVKIPELLGKIAGDNTNTAIFLFVLMFVILGAIIFYAHKKKHEMVYTIVTCVFFIMIGWTTYATILIRSNQNTPINENAPKNFTEFLSYLNREQYGDFPTFKRRFSQEAHQQGIYDTSKYANDLSFVWKYQMNHMMTRYILWTYGGRSSWYQDAGPNVWPFNGVGNIFGKLFNLKFEGDSHNSFFGIPFLIGLLGIWFHFKKDWKMATAFLILFIFTTYLFAFYQNQQEPQPRERDKFYAAGGFAFAIWIGIAVQGLLELIKEKVSSASMARSLSWAVVVVCFLFVPARMLQANYMEHDRSRNWVPWDLAYNLLQSCAPNAILFTNGDNDTFPLWYLQEVEGIRTDIRIVNLSLGNTPWYVNQLKNQEPHGAMKVKLSFPDEMLTEQNFRPIPWDPAMDSIMVPPDYYKKSVNYNNYAGLSEKAKAFLKDEYDVKDSTIIRSGKIVWRVDNSVSYNGVKALRVQDLLVKDIIEQNNWERPIYFAVTCSEDCKVGIGEYLKMEGIAYRLVPERRPGAGAELVNEQILRTQLFEENPSYRKVYEPGFKFRGLNDKTVFLDDNQERLVQNYRNSFLRLSLYYINSGQKELCLKTLNLMEARMPAANIRMDYRLSYEIARLYASADDLSKAKTIRTKVEAEALKSIEEAPTDFTPYQVLIKMYEEDKSYDKLIAIFTKLQMSYPDDPSIKQSIQRYKALKQAGDTLSQNKQ